MKNIIFNTCPLLTALLGSVSVLFASNLPECNKSAEFWNNCFGTNFFEDGEKYIGEYKDNKYHGCLAPYICPVIFGFSNKVSGIGVRLFNA